MTRISQQLLGALFALGCGSGAMASPSHGQWLDDYPSQSQTTYPGQSQTTYPGQSQTTYPGQSQTTSPASQAPGQTSPTYRGSSACAGCPQAQGTPQGTPPQGPSADRTPPSTWDPDQANPHAAPPDQAQQGRPLDDRDDVDDANTADTDTTDRRRLGVLVMSMTPELRQAMGAPRGRGVLIARVEPGSTAERAGIRAGDVLTRVGGRQVTSGNDVIQALEAHEGGRIRLSVVRQGRGLRLDTVLPTREQPQPPDEDEDDDI